MARGGSADSDIAFDFWFHTSFLELTAVASASGSSGSGAAEAEAEAVLGDVYTLTIEGREALDKAAVKDKRIPPELKLELVFREYLGDGVAAPEYSEAMPAEEEDGKAVAEVDAKGERCPVLC